MNKRIFMVKSMVNKIANDCMETVVCLLTARAYIFMHVLPHCTVMGFRILLSCKYI